MESSRSFALRVLPLLLVCLSSGWPLGAQDADEVRSLLDARVGGIERLQVPENAEDLPQPLLPDETVDPRFAITAEKVRLGKLLFFDPVRSTDIRPEFGGVVETTKTASCGSCHIGQAASKAGTLTAVGVGGEGRHETSATGLQRIDRTMIEGLGDILPTSVEMIDAEGNVVASGRFDAVDAPGRVSPSCIGFAYNNRLLWGGEAGEVNPEGYPAQEDIVRLASMAHRMASSDFSHLQDLAVYRKLFEDAFPEVDPQNLDDLINLDTQVRAIAAFLRTAITRDTPWDRFLAGDDPALTPRQLRGAWLFSASVEDGGASCISCHSGPALNKVLGDEKGLLVEENFQNVGASEHPLVALARETLEDADFHDTGRIGVTGEPSYDYAFKSPTLRQVKDAAPYFHGGHAETLHDVVEYFNAGIAAGELAAEAGSLSPLFTQPRGDGRAGLGLSEEDLDALVDFLENGLYDPAFVVHDASSPTRTFELNMDDLTYSDELKALGAVDGWLPTFMPNGFNDEKSRGQLLFLRGDGNSDNNVDLADAIFTLSFLFWGGFRPHPMEAADANGDGRVDVTDATFVVGYLFLGDRAPPFPFPEIGQNLAQ